MDKIDIEKILNPNLLLDVNKIYKIKSIESYLKGEKEVVEQPSLNSMYVFDGYYDPVNYNGFIEISKNINLMYSNVVHVMLNPSAAIDSSDCIGEMMLSESGTDRAFKDFMKELGRNKAYLTTDILKVIEKDDEAILLSESKSNKVYEYLKENPDILKLNLKILAKEFKTYMEITGHSNLLILPWGKDSYTMMLSIIDELNEALGEGMSVEVLRIEDDVCIYHPTYLNRGLKRTETVWDKKSKPSAGSNNYKKQYKIITKYKNQILKKEKLKRI